MKKQLKYVLNVIKVLAPNHLTCTGWEGPCGKPAKRRRQNTAYVDDELNWVTLCPDCMAACDEHWRERWETARGG